jgi:hypothetical protein
MYRYVCVLIFLFATGAGYPADSPGIPQSEIAKIEALLTTIGTQTNLKFIRNGSEYESATAVKFLRGKWDRQRSSVGNAREFIDKVARQSSTTGQPYRIRFPDGHEIDCAVFLTNRLAELEAK